MRYSLRLGLLTAGISVASNAFAQRGANYEGTAKPWDSPSQGYPGYFDTQVAKKGSLVMEFPPLIYGIIPMPSMAIDYGVTETVTIGTNALVTTLPWLFGAQGASIKARTLMVGTEEHQSAATVYAGYIAVQGQTPISILYQNATWNHAWRPAEAHTLYAHVNYLRLSANAGKSTHVDHMQLSATTFMLGGGYSYTMDDNWDIRGIAAATAYSNLDAITTGVDLSQTTMLFASKQAPSRVAQLQLEYHTQTDWLVSFGLIHAYASGAGGTAPWVTFATRM